MKMDSNTILITGGTSGIGFEFAKRLLALGNKVLITGRDKEKLERAKKSLPGIHVFQSDVSDPVSIKMLHQEVSGRFPQLNVLINNAGIMRNLDLNNPKVDLADVVQEVEINLSGTIRMVQQFLPTLKANRHSVIVNVSSGLAFIPFSLSPVYGATKAGIHSYSQALRVQLKGTNVRVVELAPPATGTALMEAFGPGLSSGQMSTEKMVDSALRGLANEKTEILPGAAKALKLMSRIAPRFFFNRLSEVFAKLAATPSKKPKR
jgi:uncharacterized oxidoreductase